MGATRPFPDVCCSWNTRTARISPCSGRPRVRMRGASPMSEVNRRRFLQLAGATTAFTALSNSIERAAALPANHRSGSIEDVEHIVVLMQENRSFDHYFGSLRGVRGFGDPRPVTWPDGTSVWHQKDANGKEILPFHPDADGLGLAFI